MYTQEEIKEYNSLIGKFMGGEIAKHSIFTCINFTDNYIPEPKTKFKSYDLIFLKYHSSWDWLKPVIDKIIHTIGMRTIDECTEEEWFQCTRITRMYIGVDIETAYHYVIEWINWYNNENKSTI